MMTRFKKKVILKTFGCVCLLLVALKFAQTIWTSIDCVLQSRSDLNFELNQDLCTVTQETLSLRHRLNTLHLDPAHIIVDELIEIIVGSPTLCQINDKNYMNESGRDSQKKLFIVLVESSRSNFYERNLIRKTWGSLKSHNNWQVRVVFLMGQSVHCLSPGALCGSSRSSRNQEASLLVAEYQSYEDIVIGAFADTYGNLTYKTLLGFNFVLQKCPQANLIVKTDDDVFLDIPRLLELRDIHLYSSINFGTKEPDMYCWYITRATPIRCRFCPYGKYFMSDEEWPDEYYPPYCKGGGYAISKEWLYKLYSARREGGFLRFEDIFITGVLKNIAERTHGVSANVMDISSNLTDIGYSYLYWDYCSQGNDVGIFVYLPDRTSSVFERYMKCLWERSQQYKL